MAEFFWAFEHAQLVDLEHQRFTGQATVRARMDVLLDEIKERLAN